MKMMLSLFLAGLVVWFIAAVCVITLGGCMDTGLGQFKYVSHLDARAAVAVREIPIWVDKNFAPVDRVAILDAVNTWNYALNGYIHLKIVDQEFDMEPSKIVMQVRQGGWLFLKISSKSPIIPNAKVGFRVLGFTEMVGGQHMWLVTDRLMNEDVFGVTLHEIGHLLGSGHTEGEHLMYPYYTRVRYQCIDKESLSKVAKYQRLPLDRLNYCIGLNEMEKPAEVSQAPENKSGCPLGE